MKTIRESAREVPVIAETDVLVVGSGPGGLAATLTSAVMFSCSGVNKKRFLEYVRENPSSYKDWGKNWNIQKGGKDDDLFSPYLQTPFDSIGGTWSAVSDQGEATYLNMIHLTGVDGTDLWDLARGEMEGRSQALMAIKALNRFAPGFEEAKLRTYGMTLAVRDTRKIVGRYELTEEDVRNQARFDESCFRKMSKIFWWPAEASPATRCPTPPFAT